MVTKTGSSTAKRWVALALGVSLLGAAATAGAAASGGAIKVMTRNQYLGADLAPVVTATSFDEFFAAAGAALAQVAANNFPRRAKGFAREVFLTRPDVIALQEVYDFTLNERNGAPPFVDHLQATLDALASAGLRYVVAGTAERLDVTLPVDVNGDGSPELVRMLDRDVILVRKGLVFRNLAGDVQNGGLCGVRLPNPALVDPFPAELASTVAQDGCNFSITARVNSPAGLIVVKRGFLGVDVQVNGKDYRVIDTHLEERFPSSDPLSAIVQFLQAVELVGTLQATTPAGRTLIVAGDFNSAPVETPIDTPLGPIVPPYQIMVGYGFTDAWEENPLRLFDPDGFTCCQEPDLSNRTSELYERIDHLFTKSTKPVRSLAFVTGRVPLFPLGTPPNWASDHGGVFGELIFAR
ncbi:MAG: endonuclease/exonuclease/phosphatase family protein [Deltaproteobacteria bacterium]|nr:endonuclease/exonuclease/phosphatase family protein [Deltaproteobacteria bacterium]